MAKSVATGAELPMVTRSRLLLSVATLNDVAKDWATIRRRIKRARQQIGAAKGWRSKLREMRNLLRKARARFAKRLEKALSASAVPLSSLDRQTAQAWQSKAYQGLITAPPEGAVCRSLGGGTVMIYLRPAPSEVPTVYFRDRLGNMHVAQITDFGCANAAVGRSSTLNRRFLKFRPSGDASLAGQDAGAAPDAEQSFPVAAASHDDVGHSAVASARVAVSGEGSEWLTSLGKYRFSALLTPRGCVCDLSVTFVTQGGQILQGPRRMVDPVSDDIATLSGQNAIEIAFELPQDTAAIALAIQGNVTQAVNPGYVTIANPVLEEVEAAALPGATIWATGIVSRVADLEKNIAGLIARAPSELFEEGSAHVDVHVCTSTQKLVFPNMLIQNVAVIAVHKLSFENNTIFVSGNMADTNAETIDLGVFVDGELSASGSFACRPGAFSGAMVLDSGHLDGCSHLLEIRQLPGLDLLASSYEFLPLHITPWNALQTYARPPLDETLSPQARHHFRSYRLWLEQAKPGGARIPPLGELFHEISQGFRKRDTYPKIEFAPVLDPVVSIVIPVHNKFEVTYYCLCSLLFAFNETRFEVIVVDDASSDETRNIADFVGGIEIVRHESNLGFVRSCNDGAARARGEFIVLLNNDTQVTARWLDELVSTCRDFDNVGLVGSKLVYPDGRLQEAGGVIWGSGNPWNVGRGGSATDPKYNYLRQVDYLSGAAIMIPRDIWQKVGGFSAEFAPAYFEDTDLAMKVREAGHLVAYVPTSTVYHFEGQSAGTSVASGLKYYQEVNRPKFKKKWAHAFRDHGREAENLDREKDRNVAFRVLFVDHQFPLVDVDAGSHASFQEVRLFQSQGAKVTFLPRNLAWMDRHTLALQRIGVECLYAPHVTNFLEYVRTHAAEYDAVYVCRYKIAEQVIPIARAASRNVKIIFNLADLHFLRELREAAAKSPGYSRERAEETRNAELSMVMASDLTFSYSDVELGVLESHVREGTKLAKLPWIVDSQKLARRFADTKDILFLGGFGHHPNGQAVRFFATEVMPSIREKLPDVVFNVIGSGGRATLSDLASDSVRIIGYVPDLDEPLARTRVFVAPLFAGAGLKGKVLEAMSRGVPCVLSSVAAESTGLIDGINCLVADTRDAWAEGVVRLYTDEALWEQISANARRVAETKFSFAQGTSAFEDALAKIEIFGRKEWGLVYKYAHPQRYGN